MGIVIIGGLLFSLGLTLYVIPALHTYLSAKRKFTDNSVSTSVSAPHA